MEDTGIPASDDAVVTGHAASAVTGATHMLAAPCHAELPEVEPTARRRWTPAPPRF